MAEREVHVVVGAAGVTGRLVVRHLLAAGCRVRAVTRDGRAVGEGGAEPVAADAADPVALAAAAAGAAALHHCAMPPLPRWRRDFPPLTDAVIGAGEATGARVVYADDTWMYGRVAGPMTPDLPYRPVSAAGVLRAWLAQRLEHAAAAGRIRLSVVRAGELYGPGVRSMIAGNVFGAVARGRTAHWFGRPDLPITPTYVDDFARTIAAAGRFDRSAGRVWHVPHPGAVTGRELVALAAGLAGRRPAVTAITGRQLRLLGTVVPLARQAADLLYQFEQPFVVDGTAAAAAFDLDPTPYAQGVRDTLRSLGVAGSERPDPRVLRPVSQ
ncbi:NAD-dependent epimerase/dehydratase family protein [Nakamurella sp.]|uniref:NAD-dependent epimerase/dehydratase family protein n=1 Tax=Nakamurella sp. TaxID=1869182 RepID=UPI003B3AB7A7